MGCSKNKKIENESPDVIPYIRRFTTDIRKQIDEENGISSENELLIS